MAKKRYAKVLCAEKVWLFLIPSECDPRYCAITKSIRALEQAIPFPYKKGEPEIHVVDQGEDHNKFMVSMLVTYEKEMSWPDAEKFLIGAGFSCKSS